MLLTALAALALQVPTPQQGVGPDPALVHANGRVPPALTATRTVAAPVLDGSLDDAVWAGAEIATGFRRDRPSDGEPAAEATEVRVLYDDDALYVGARMHQRDPATVSRLRGRRDAGQFNDTFFAMIDSYHDHRTAFVFGVTPAGGRRDMTMADDGAVLDDSWDAVWEVATAIDEGGWTAELRIPLSQLRYDARERPVWGIQFRRDIMHVAEAVDWAWASRNESGWVSKFGHLLGLEDLPRPSRLEVLPYTVMQGAFRGDAAPANPFDDGSVYDVTAGADLKYGVTSGVTLDATINPDFGQVEADPAVVNLTAFETFFQEKRPFFVEGASIFDFGGTGSERFFYSRRVGQPPSRAYDAGGGYLDQPAATTILGAAKLSGQTRSGWSVGLLEAVTQREVARVAGPAGGRLADVPVEPLTNWAVARVRRDLRGGSTGIGFIATAVNRQLDDDGLDFLRGSAYSGGVDVLHRFHGNAYALRGWAGGSWIGGSTTALLEAQRSSARYFQRPDQDYVTLDASRTDLAGWAGGLRLSRESGSWTAGLGGEAYSPGFELNDAGFLTEVDRVRLAAELGPRWPAPVGPFRNADIRFSGSGAWNFGGTPVGRDLRVRANGQFRSYRSANLDVFWNLPSLDDRVTRGGPLMHSPGALNVNGGFNGDSRNPVSFGLGLGFMVGGEGAWGFGIGPNLQGRSEGALTFSIRPTYRRIHTPAYYVTQAEDPAAAATHGSRYVFATLDQHSVDIVGRLDYALTPRATLQLYLQPFVATGDYEAFRALARPRSYEFLEYGRDGASVIAFDPDAAAYVADADGPGPAPELRIANPDFRVRSLRGNLVLRWEYLRGSTLFLVWSQDRAFSTTDPRLDGIADVARTFTDPLRSVLLLKANYWLDF